MAFKTAAENTSSLKLNHIPNGAFVDLYDFKTKKLFAHGAKLIGWKNGKGESISAPSVMLSMPKDTTVSFEVYHEGNTAIITLVKDPNGWGCMFRNVQTDETKAPILRRVTAYASSEVIRTVRAKQAKPKEETPEVKQEQVTEEKPTSKKK